ncbi:MAG: hypothetical protein HY578_03980 [Nitrospinae bacterium]|nr:hypothetical protein [Nitrospinota bacterium]
MKFKLFLKEITREMIDSGRISTPAGEGWSGNVWSKECCVINFMHQRPGTEVVLPLHGAMLMRAEPDGGLVWSPSTNAVYKVDGEAYRVMRDLDSGYSEREVAKRNKVRLRAVKRLLAEVNTALKR